MFSLDHDHKKCTKKHKWFITCSTIWEQGKLLAAIVKEEKGAKKYTISNLVEDLIQKRFKEVFSKYQK